MFASSNEKRKSRLPFLSISLSGIGSHSTNEASFCPPIIIAVYVDTRHPVDAIEFIILRATGRLYYYGFIYWDRHMCDVNAYLLVMLIYTCSIYVAQQQLRR
ncbi:hypothetical protein BCR43DRAFT_264636 [Syncephalastrum racemosum]|uniref:Uncharacterized protein n=1 Tax=Syncephalastrum racemosum TaxID=13706 RepID=A0A1X2HH48_SYNRA|nr:hypothetical protein BCR43DRAFT_264636 [Syncephalastrum racemosum]